MGQHVVSPVQGTPGRSGRVPEHVFDRVEAVVRCDGCGNGEISLGRKPKVVQRDGRVAVVTEIPIEECPSCGMTWLDGPVARRLDDLFREMLAADAVALRPYR